MFVLELYFLLYRVPKMMTRLARERGRGALKWSLLGMGVWLAVEFGVVATAGLIYGLGEAFLNWPKPIAPGFKIVAYILALVAALLSVTILSRLLMGIPKEKEFVTPPPPPEFFSESERAD